MSGASVTSVKSKPDLRGITAAKLLQTTFPSREFAIDPWLRTGESALIWAATGVGKTWLTLSLALAMAGGGRVWEWKAPKARKVLIVDGEMNVQDLQERINHLMDTGAVDGLDREIMGRNLLLMPRQYQNPRAQFYDITDPESQGRILDQMETKGAEVIIIDNLTTCADGLADENDATAFRSIMGFLLMMKQAGKTAIVVHHANKAGTDARGSTALEATFEVKLGLQRPPVVKPGEASFITEFGKFRGRGNDSLRPRVWTLRESGWDVQDDTGSADQRVLDAVRTLKYVNQSELAAALGMAQGTVSKALSRAVAIGSIKKDILDRLWIDARTLRKGDADPFGLEPSAEPNEDF